MYRRKNSIIKGYDLKTDPFVIIRPFSNQRLRLWIRFPDPFSGLKSPDEARAIVNRGQASLSRSRGFEKGHRIAESYHRGDCPLRIVASAPSHENYRHATKVLGLNVGRTYLPLRPVPLANTPDPGAGVFLAPSDMEELSMLIRIGNEVEVKTAG